MIIHSGNIVSLVSFLLCFLVDLLHFLVYICYHIYCILKTVQAYSNGLGIAGCEQHH